MKRVSTITVIAGALLLASTAVAQEVDGPLGDRQETGTAMRRTAQPVEDQALINRYSKAVAQCVMNRAGDNVRSLLQYSDPQVIDFEASGVNRGRFLRTFERCMGQRMEEFSNNVLLANVGMSFSDARLRALLIEEAYLADQGVPPAIPAGATERTDRPYFSAGADLQTAQGLGAFADCIAYRDATGADALLHTEPGSPEELQAARALAPTLGDCLIAGQELQLTPASIRAMAADGLWTRATFGAAGNGARSE